MRTNIVRSIKPSLDRARLAHLLGAGPGALVAQLLRAGIPLPVGATTWINDLWNNVAVGMTLEPQAIAAAANGVSIDCSGMEGQIFVALLAGTVTDGGYTFTLEEDTVSAFSAPTALAFAEGAIAEITAANDQSMYFRRAKRTKRFVRVVIAETTAGVTGGVFAVAILGMRKAGVGPALT